MKHITLNFTLAHINAILVESWEAFKLSSDSITQDYFKKTHLLPIYPTGEDKKHQYSLAATKVYKYHKWDDI